MHVKTRMILPLALALLVPFAAAATDLRVAVGKEPISVGQGRPLLYVAFDDVPMRAELLLVVVDTANNPMPAEELRKLRSMDAGSWAGRVRFTIRDAATRQVVQTLDGARLTASQVLRTEEGPNAPQPELRKPGLDYVTYRATVELPRLAPGDYEIEATLGQVRATDVFNARGADAPEPKVHAAYLGRQAARSQTFEAYKRLQNERLQATPNDASILLELGHRAMADGTVEEAQAFFDRAVAVMQENVKQTAKQHPQAAKSIAALGERRVREVRGLQSLLPEYFASRGTVRVEQQTVNGRTRWILKDRDRPPDPLR